MKSPQTLDPMPAPLRLWPGLLLVALQWGVRFGVPLAVPAATGLGLLGGLVGGLAVALWWVFFSRAPRSERWGAVAVMVVALGLTPRLLHESIARGAMGLTYFFYAIPVLSLALVAWAAVSRRLPIGPRRATLVATLLLACLVWTLFRSEGVTGDFAADFAWRWTPTAEQRLLARGDDVLPALRPTEAAAATGADWPGFRGPARDGIVPGLRIASDWSLSPPAELWRRPVGPGWSSFAVRGDRFYTQEQRGEDEVVACYQLDTGEPLWRHRDPVRFWDPEGGTGPRATPSLGQGRVFTLGATGILNALDAGSGAVVWSRDAASERGAKAPQYGFTSSPLLVDDLVLVYTDALVAYDQATGALRWAGPPGGEGYSSPQPVTIGGVAQVLQLSASGASSVAPAAGTLLWEHPWASTKLVQPALTAEGDVLIGTWFRDGTRRLAVAPGPGGWSVEERWTSRALKPDFSDFVVHRGHAYGFDGGILACIELQEGQRAWKGGRYGHGQLLLLSEQGLLLVLSEEGELALVRANPEAFTELARRPAIEGKTWNHPALAGDRLLVRNAQGMAAFRLARARD